MAKTPIHALITRPEEDAASLADALRQRGVEVAIEPLLSIRTLPGAAIDLTGVQAVLFTSSNGVRAFAELSPRRDLPAFAVGDATAAAALAAGFTQFKSAGGDVRDLARLVGSSLKPADGLLFHAAASAVAGDLAGALEAAGFGLRRAVLYEAKPAEQLSEATLRRLADGAINWVLFFSPRTAATFVRLIETAPAAERERLAAGVGRAEALCLSPAVADAAQKLSWRSVLSALRPDLPGMLQLVDATLAENAPAATSAASPAAAAAPAAPEASRPASPPQPAPAPRPALPPQPAMPPTRSGIGAGATVLVAAVVALVVALAVVMSQDLWRAPPPAPAAADAALRQRLDAFDRSLAEAGSAIATLHQQMGVRPSAPPAALPTEIAALPERLAALQQQVDKLAAQPATTTAAALPPEVAALPDRVAGLEQKLQAMTAQQPQDAAASQADQAALAKLQEQLDKLQQESTGLHIDVAAAQTQLAALQAAAAKLPALDQAIADLRRETTDRGALLLAVGQLATALDESHPFATPLAVLRRLAAARPAVAAELGPSLDAVAPAAERGIATLAELKAAFPAMAKAVVDRTGAPDQGSIGARLLGRVEQLVTIRPVGGEVQGDEPAARIARAETRLAADDLAGAVAEVGAITGIAAEPAGAWLAAARARLAAAQAIERLRATALALPAEAPAAATQPRRRRRRRAARRPRA